MKRCPECCRDYYDDSLLYCLDDGSALLEGPASADESPTAILSGPDSTKNEISGLTTGTGTLLSKSSRPKRYLLVSFLLLVAIGLGGFFAYRYFAPTKQIESIAVMPFVNESGNPDFEYLSDGITESLINSLSQIPGISVKARSSVFTYKGRTVSTQQVAQDLGVQAVLNGRILQRGDQVLMNVEMVDASTGNQIWGDQYTRQSADLLKLQSEIASDVSKKLKARLTGAESQKVARNYTENTEAYHLYLRGRYYWNRRTADDIKKSVDYFQQAIDKDPTYALAYAGLAEAYILMSSYGAASPKESFPKARVAASKAIEMDPSLAEAHNALASVLGSYDWKFAEAEAEWRNTLALNPNYASGRQWYAEHLLFMGRYSEGLEEMKRAQDVDPLSLIINGLVGVAYRMNGQNDQALEQLTKTLELDPNFSRTHLFLAETYQTMGQYEKAMDEFGRAFILEGVPAEKITPALAFVKERYRTEGPKGYSRAMAEIFEPNQGPNEPPKTVVASYWGAAGEFDKAFALLEKGFEEHDDDMLMIKDPRMGALKSDPRYKDLLRRMGLPE